MTSRVETNVHVNNLVDYMYEMNYLGQIISFANRQAKEIDQQIFQRFQKF